MAGVSVEKRGKTWRYRFDTAPICGKRNRVSKGGFASKKEAMDAGVAALSEYNNTGLAFSPKEISYADYLSFWVEEYGRVNLKVGSVNEYIYKIDHYIKPALGMYYLHGLTPRIIQKLVNDMFNDGYSRNVIKHTKGLIYSTLAYAVEPLQFLKENPAELVRMPRRGAQPKQPTRSNPHVYITKEQIDEIFHRFPETKNAHLPLRLGYACGLRCGEIFGLAVDDINFEKKTIRINRQMQRDIARKVWYITEPKYGSCREISVDADTLNYLRIRVQRIESLKGKLGDEYPKYYIADDGVITQEPTGKPIDFLNVNSRGAVIYMGAVRNTVEVIQHDLKIEEFDFHSLRHTHATMLVEKGAPLKWVQERLGHKSIEVTLKIYQHVTDDITRAGNNTLEQMFEINSISENAEKSELSSVLVPTS